MVPGTNVLATNWICEFGAMVLGELAKSRMPLTVTT